MKYARTAGMFFNTPMALLPAKAEEVRAFWTAKLAGGGIDFDDRQEPFAARLLAMDDWFASGGGDAPELEAAAKNSARAGGQIAVIPLHGVMAQRMNLMSAMSGGTSTQMFVEELRKQVADPNVSAVIVDVASPGGSVYGTDELAAEVYRLRDEKPIVAVANSEMFSAAYYAMSQASEVVVTPGGEVGSIGVVALHVDQSGWNEKEGIKPTYVHAGKYKVEGNPHEPLGDEARSALQAQVDRYYGMFLRAVARGRETSVGTVENRFGQGRIFGAQEAVRRGLADRVATLDETIRRFASGGRVSRRGPGAEAKDDDPEVVPFYDERPEANASEGPDERTRTRARIVELTRR